MRSVRPGNLWNYSFIHPTQRSTKRSSSNFVFAIPETSRFRRWNGIAWEPWDGVEGNEIDASIRGRYGFSHLRSNPFSETGSDRVWTDSRSFKSWEFFPCPRFFPFHPGGECSVSQLPRGPEGDPPPPQRIPKCTATVRKSVCVYAGIMSGRAFLPCLEFRVLGPPKKGGWRALGRSVWGWMNE